MNSFTFIFSKFFLAFLLLSQVLTSCRDGAIDNHQILTEQVIQYEKSEFRIILNENFKNPYDVAEIELNMILNSPGGKDLLLPCYFEEGDTVRSVWYARFTPQEAGTYSYYFQVIKNTKDLKESRKHKFVAAPSDLDGFLHINDFWTLKFDSGKPFRGIGENVGWESTTPKEGLQWTFDYLLPTLSDNGANFFRAWMCPWNFPVDWQDVSSIRYEDSDQYFNPSAIKRFEEVLELIDSLDLYMMISMNFHGDLMVGRNWEVNPFNVRNGGPASSPVEFFTLEASKKKYKNRLRYIVARWGYSPRIAAWEFFNEIDNAVFRGDSAIIPQDAVTSWHTGMTDYLKSIDPFDHIVTTSISTRGIEGLFDIENMDLNQKHEYVSTKLIPSGIGDYVETHKKPFCWGEFGYTWDARIDFSTISEELKHDYKIGLWYGLFNPTPILPLTWWWEWFDDQGMTPYFNKVRKIHDMMLHAGDGSYESVPVTAGETETYAVNCGNTYFAYVLNESSTPVITDMVLHPDSGDPNTLRIRIYDPEIDGFSEAGSTHTTNGRITIPQLEIGAKTNLILIISP